MEYLKWIVTSSADPQKYSLMVKSALLSVVPFLIQGLQLTCGIHLVCLAVDGSVLSTVADTVANIVYMALSIIAGVGFLWGLGRKIWLNRWSAYNVAPNNLPTA